MLGWKDWKNIQAAQGNQAAIGKTQGMEDQAGANLRSELQMGVLLGESKNWMYSAGFKME